MAKTDVLLRVNGVLFRADLIRTPTMYTEANEAARRRWRDGATGTYPVRPAGPDTVADQVPEPAS